MNPVDLTRWSEIRAHFDEIVDLDPIQRSERLTRIGKTDPELRSAVESLIRVDAVADLQLKRLEFAATDLMLAHSDCMSVVVADPLSLSGRTISHFRILEPVGSGGMGVVYRAEDTRLNRAVALKFPLPYQALDSATRERFLREARSAGGLDHPNLCSIHEVGESEAGHCFLAMPFYVGETLKARLSGKSPLPIRESLDLARQIAEGLACVHAAGIVHRDLKPGNLMVLPDGTVKILDFGLAKVSDLSRTLSTGIVGTAGYMAPEQINGSEVDGRTDLWALGVVLYEMLVGERPFSGENELSVAHAIVHDAPVRPSQLRTEIPRAVERLVLTLLEKDPANRYSSAQAVADDVVAIQRGEAPPFAHHPRRRAKMWLRSRGKRAAVLSALAIILLAIAVFGAQRIPASIQRPPTESAEAYDLFLQGQEYETRVWAAHDWNPEWLRAAETLYRRALAIDPGFALARAQLGSILATHQYDTRQRSAEGLEQVRQEAEAAIKLQPELGEAHLVMSFYWDMRGEYERARTELELARKTSPQIAEVHSHLGSVYLSLGRWDDAVASYQRARRLDPKREVQLARTYARLRRYKQAAHSYDQYLAFFPDDYGQMLGKGYLFIRWDGTADTLAAVLRRVPMNWDPEGRGTQARVAVARIERRPAEALAALATSRHVFFYNHEPLSLTRATVYSQAGDSARAAVDYEIARGMLEDSVAAHSDDVRWRIALAKALAGLGRSSDAIRETEHALRLVAEMENVEIGQHVMAGAAAVFARLRNNDRAIDLVEQLLQNPSAGLAATGPGLRGDPTWDPLQNDPRFQRLLVKYGARPGRGSPDAISFSRS